MDREAGHRRPDRDDPRTVLGDIAFGLSSALGDDLLGLYVHGSWVTGDFSPARSDLDLLAVLSLEPSEGVLGAVAATHVALERSHPSWRGRIEVEYVSRAAVMAFAQGPRPLTGHTLMRISPGEALHLLSATEHRVLTWAGVRTIGQPLVGPPAAQLLPAFDDATAHAAVRLHVHDWPQWVREMEHPGGQAYAVLTLSRAWCLLVDGDRLSKRAAAERAAAALPEWRGLIEWARDWWYAAGSDREPSRLDQCAAFVDDVSARLLRAPPLDTRRA